MDDTNKIIQTIRKLQKHTSGSFPVLSVYVDLKNTKGENDPADKFHSLLDALVTNGEEDILEKDILEITAYLKTTHQHDDNKNIAIFSGGNTIWEVILHDFSIPSLVKVSYTPFLSPLLSALKNQRRFLVILADRKKAFFFTMKNGAVEAFEQFKDAIVPQKVKAIKELMGQDTHITRHIENHLHRHLQRISHHVDRFVKGRYIQAVIVGGHKPLLHKIEKHLNSSLQKKLAGEFVTELNIPKNDLVKHAKTAIAQIST